MSDESSENSTPLKKTLEVCKSISVIVAAPLTLFAALTSDVFNKDPIITLVGVLIIAIAASYIAYRYWQVNGITIFVAWLTFMVVAIVIFLKPPPTITVEGFILDSGKNPVRYEKVILVDVYGISREKETDDTGYYQFTGVPNDVYRVKVRDNESGGNAKGNLFFLHLEQNFILPIPTLTPTVTATPTETPTPTLTSTPTLISTSTFTPSPTQHFVARVDNLSGWKPDFCDDLCGGTNGSSSISIRLAPGRTNNVIEVAFDVKQAGYVVITKNIDPKTLSGTKGVTFYYKGSGADNTLEFKLLLRYLGDTEDTIYGITWPNETNTGDTWKLREVLYSDLSCWGPANNCQLHGDRVDLNMVLRMDVAVSNKPGDTPGIGIVYFEDVLGIPLP